MSGTILTVAAGFFSGIKNNWPRSYSSPPLPPTRTLYVRAFRFPIRTDPYLLPIFVRLHCSSFAHGHWLPSRYLPPLSHYSRLLRDLRPTICLAGPRFLRSLPSNLRRVFPPHHGTTTSATTIERVRYRHYWNFVWVLFACRTT